MSDTTIAVCPKNDKKIEKLVEIDNVKNDVIEVENVFTGLDKGLDYIKSKKRLLRRMEGTLLNIESLDETETFYDRKFKMLIKKYIYLIIATIQLRNGSRVSEACKAFLIFFKKGVFDVRAVVKIAKSDTTKYKDGKAHKLKARFREIVFPNWFNLKYVYDINITLLTIKSSTLQKRVLDFLRNNFNWNTHSLRYAFINYMINEEKVSTNIVSKFVGHTSMNTILTYTQKKCCDKIFDMDI